MFSRKLTLTASTYRILNDVTRMLEVLLGTRVWMKEIELEANRISGHGVFVADEVEYPILFDRHPIDEDSYQFKIQQWYVAQFGNRPTVRVARNIGSSNWMVGASATDRHEEPVFPKQ